MDSTTCSPEYFALRFDAVTSAHWNLRRANARPRFTCLCTRVALVAAAVLLLSAIWFVTSAVAEQAANVQAAPLQPAQATTWPCFPTAGRSTPRPLSLHLGGNCWHAYPSAIMSDNETAVEAVPTGPRPIDLARGS